MTTTTLDRRTLQGCGGSWVAAPVRSAGPAPLDPQRLLAAFAAAVAVTLLVMFVLGLLAAPGGDPASASGGEPAHLAAPAAQVHVAAPGDSLWTIARANHGDVGFDRYLDTLIRLNGGTVIHAGQAVQLP